MIDSLTLKTYHRDLMSGPSFRAHFTGRALSFLNIHSIYLSITHIMVHQARVLLIPSHNPQAQPRQYHPPMHHLQYYEQVR
jgi:hypothetical protein